MGERRERNRGDGDVGIASILGEDDVGVGESGDERECSRIVDRLHSIRQSLRMTT